MKEWTENAKLLMAVCGMVAVFASCGFVGDPLLVLGVWVVCVAVGFVALVYGYTGDPSPRKGRGLSEEEQARDAVAGGMFMDGDDLLG